MAANENWSRWIFASLSDYLKGVATGLAIPGLIEGVDDRTDAFVLATDKVEIRINGPYIRELSADYWRFIVDANVLASSRYDETKNAHIQEKILGKYAEAMEAAIPVFKRGIEPGDDNSQIGCLSPRDGKNDQLRILRFGQMNGVDRLKQAAVDCRYVMYLET